MGVASAQSYGPINGATFTVTGTTDLAISGSSVNGEFSVVNPNFLNSLRPYGVETFGGLVVESVDISSDGIITVEELTDLGFSSEMLSDLSVFLDGTLTIYDADGNVVVQTDITDYNDIKIEIADGFSASSGYTWQILI